MQRVWKGLLAGSLAGGALYYLFSRRRKAQPKGLIARGLWGMRKASSRATKRWGRNARDWQGFVRTGGRVYRRGRGAASIARRLWNR